MSEDAANRPPTDEQWIEQRLLAALQVLDSGADLDLDELCAERPRLLPALAEALGLHGDLPDLPGHGAAAARDADNALRDHLLAGRYRLVDPIGRGPTGAVFRARDERLDCEVAVKLVRTRLLGGREAAERFREQARILAQLAHPHIVRVYDVGVGEDGQTFLVTELLRGHGLHTIVAAARTAMPDGPSAAAFSHAAWLTALLPDANLEPGLLRQAVRWCAELGSGLAAAHAVGVPHGAVKPGNAFVRADGSAALLDFGLTGRSPAGVLEHAIVSTPCYLAPEQAANAVRSAPALDVYGLAATLYHLLTLRPPHQGDFATVLEAVRSEDPVPASWIHRGLPVDLQAVLDKGLERHLHRRYGRMDDMVADLRAFLDHGPVSVQPLGGWQRTLRKARRRPVHFLATMLAVLMVVGLTIAVPALAALAAVDVGRRSAERHARLPADFAIAGAPAPPPEVLTGERAALLAELDQLLELDDSDLLARLLRSAVRLDAGDAAGAHADVAALAAARPSTRLEALASRYAAADPQARGPAAVDLTGLPPPQTETDFLVAGFHALRAQEPARALELLAQAADQPPARHLRLQALLLASPPDPVRILAAAEDVELARGRPTMASLQGRGAALMMLRRHAEALPVLAAAVELRVDLWGPRVDLGTALLRTGRAADALPHLEQAVELRPWHDRSRRLLARTLSALGRHEAAHAAADLLRDRALRAFALGAVAMQRALAQPADDDGSRRAAAVAAAGHFEEAAELAGGAAGGDASEASGRAGRAALAERARAAAGAARALAAGDPTGALVPFLDELRLRPTDPTQLGNLADLLGGEELAGPALLRLRLLLVELALDLAPDDPRLQARRAELLEELR